MYVRQMYDVSTFWNEMDEKCRELSEISHFLCGACTHTHTQHTNITFASPPPLAPTPSQKRHPLPSLDFLRFAFIRWDRMRSWHFGFFGFLLWHFVRYIRVDWFDLIFFLLRFYYRFYFITYVGCSRSSSSSLTTMSMCESPSDTYKPNSLLNCNSFFSSRWYFFLFFPIFEFNIFASRFENEKRASETVDGMQANVTYVSFSCRTIYIRRS